MALVLASDIGRYVQEIYEDAIFVARDNNLMQPLVLNFTDRSGTAARSRSEYGTAVIAAITETDDLTSQAFTPSVANTLTPAEVGAQFMITDTRVESDPFSVRSDAAMELGMAMAQSVEKNLLGQFSSLTGGTVGAAGTVLTWGHFYAMLSRCRAQNAAFPLRFVCHPHHWHRLGSAVAPGATVTNSPDIQNSILGNFYVGSVSGVDIFTSSNIAIDGSDDAYCAMFNPQALALDWRRGVRIEPERDASRRGWELNLTALYAYGVWRPKFGVQGLFDAIAPAS
jgi:hypothetical protein